jgi:penicillin-binding protein 1C
LIAIDPDIPATRQRILFESEGTTASSRWLLDGADFGAATDTTLWTPRIGSHQLALVTPDGALLDRVSFTVRGVQ